MDKYLYLLLDCIFFVPLVWFVFATQKKTIKKYKLLLTFAIFIGAAAFFTLDVIAVGWGAWGHNPHHILGIRVYKSPIEELVWSVLLLFIATVVIVRFADIEDKKKPFKSLITPSKKK